MPAILLPLSLGAAFLVLRSSDLPDVLRSHRASLLLTSVLWALVLTAITELLTLSSGLSLWTLCAAWSTILFFLVLRLMRRRTQLDLAVPLVSHRFSTTERCFVVSVLALVGIIGLMALIAPPNTYDAMTYHMSRVMHWGQNQGVMHYPTSILRQLHQAPWAEFAILHVQLLSGTDRLANTVQWLAMIGSLIAVSLLAERLGATRRGQLLAVVVCATLPMGILQGSSTQNDYVASYWLACFVYFAGLLDRQPHLLCVLGAGGALGLAFLTKGTTYVYAAPIVAFMVISAVRHGGIKQLCVVALVVGIGLVTNLGHYHRNYDLYGSPLGPRQEGAGYGYVNDAVSPSILASNIIRNIGLHVGTPVDRINQHLDAVIETLHRLIGISASDPRTTWRDTEFHALASLHEDAAGNPAHLLCIAACMLACFVAFAKDRTILRHVGMILGGAILFCLLFKWQPWHSRLHLPLFVVSAPIVGLVLGRFRPHIADLVVTCLLIAALPWVLLNASRPLLGQRSILTTARIEQYFANQPHLAQAYIDAARVVAERDCGRIGVVTGENDWEYPLWMTLKHATSIPIYVEHVNVPNVSHAIRVTSPSKDICAIVVAGSDGPLQIHNGENVYMRMWSSNALAVYTMDPSCRVQAPTAEARRWLVPEALFA